MSEQQETHRQFNVGENIFASESGTQNIYLQQQQKMADDYRNGLEAFKNHLYPKAVQRFEDFLSTAADVSSAMAESQNTDIQPEDVQDKTARAHVYTALALLNGSAPSYHPPEVIRRIDSHLDQARKLGAGKPVAAQADAVWAVVKDDWYIAQGMPAQDPQPEELRLNLRFLDRDDLGFLMEHLAQAEGATWKQLNQMARQFGFAASQEDAADLRDNIDPKRPTAVRKYFIRTPPRVNEVHQAIFIAAALAVIVCFAAGGGYILLGLIAGGGLGRWGLTQYQAFKTYKAAYALAEPKPSDKQMDEWLEGDVEYIKRKAARKLRINTRLHPDGGDLMVPALAVVGVARAAEHHAPRTAVRWGADGNLRADHYTVLILMLTDKLISTYRCVVNFATGDLVLDEMREYHYSDIVGVSSRSIPLSRPEQQLVDTVADTRTDISIAHEFSLSITNGEALTVLTGFGGDFEASGSGSLVWRGNDHALRIIQAMVRSRHV